MTLQELVNGIAGFSNHAHSEKIKLFGWYLHVQGNRDRFTAADIRACYDVVHLPQPANVNPYLAQLTEKKSPDLLKDKGGYRLAGPVRSALDAKYGQAGSAVAIEKALADLPGKITNFAEKVFLAEALTCYRHKAFRAAIVMTWNLAYDHLLEWVLLDATRLATFNAQIGITYPKKTGLTISVKEHFEELKESEVVQICASAALISGNIKKILAEKLARRNIAAHPSSVSIVQYQADDVISDLVNNVVLRLQ